MLRLKVVKGAEADRESHQEGKEETTLHGAQILYDLVSSWRNSHRIVCADSYFASVPAALLLWRHGLRFISVIIQLQNSTLINTFITKDCVKGGMRTASSGRRITMRSVICLLMFG
jgi:hypothetical protein